MTKRCLLGLLCLGFALGAVAADRKSAAAADKVNQSFAAWNAHDLDKVVSFYTDDVVYEDVAFGQTARGRDEFRKFVQGFFTAVPDLKLEAVNVSSENGRGSVEWIFSGTDVGLYKTGKKFSVHGASRFEMRGGKFATNKDFYDVASIMRQVGVLPAGQ